MIDGIKERWANFGYQHVSNTTKTTVKNRDILIINCQLTEQQCILDQELLRIEQTNDFIRNQRASGQPTDATAYAASSGG